MDVTVDFTDVFGVEAFVLNDFCVLVLSETFPIPPALVVCLGVDVAIFAETPLIAVRIILLVVVEEAAVVVVVVVVVGFVGDGGGVVVDLVGVDAEVDDFPTILE